MGLNHKLGIKGRKLTLGGKSSNITHLNIMVINKEMNIVSCSDNCQNIDIFYATRNTW